MKLKSNQLSSRFKQVFHNTGFGIMIVDKNRNLIEVNPKFCEMLGFTKEELIGMLLSVWTAPLRSLVTGLDNLKNKKDEAA